MSSVPPTGAPVAVLRVRLGPGNPATIPLTGSVVLGRDPVSGVPIPLEGVSREHARVLWDGTAWWVEDIKSTNGTFVNGQRVDREKLQNLDVIGLGRNVDLVFVLRRAEDGKKRRGIVRAALVRDGGDGAISEVSTGEVTLGRAPSCNVVVDDNAVSKMHARILRTGDQLVLEDLGSANGTTVNDTRVRTTALKDGDVMVLAGAVRFRVVIEFGEVSDSGVFATPAVAAEPRRFSGEWKTRYEWDPTELAAMAAAARGEKPPEMLEAEAAVPRRRTTTPPPAEAPKAPPPAAKPAPAPAPKPTTEPAAAPKPAAAVPKPAAQKPVAEKPATEKPAAPKPEPEKGAAVTPPAKAAVPAPQAPKPAAPVTPAPKPAPAAPPTGEEAVIATIIGAPAPAVAAPPVERAITAVRLVGRDVDLRISEPGGYEIGRGNSVALRIANNTVSRQHALVVLDADRRSAWIEDLGAANGTRVNGKFVKRSRHALTNADLLELGEVLLKVELVF